MTSVDAVPTTTIARPLLDLADVAPARQVERAVNQATVVLRFDLRAIEDALASATGRRGAGVLRAALAEHRLGPTLTRSGLEEAFLRLVYWPEHRLVVELDGTRYHHTRRAFEIDRRRDIALQIGGLRTARFTERRIADEPQAVLKDLSDFGVDSRAGRSS